MSKIGTQPLDILIWVSDRQYTMESYIEEAKQYGACRKFGGRFPVDVEVGTSRVFLAYPYQDPNTRKAKKDRKNGQIFAYFTIQGVLVVGKAKMLQTTDEMRVQTIRASEVTEWQMRGCGLLSVGGTYFVSNDDMRHLQENAEGYLGEVEELDEVLPFKKKRWRGFHYVDGDAILEGVSQKQWFNTDEVREENHRIRHAKWLAKRQERKLMGLPLEEETDEVVPVRETYTQTVMRLLDGNPMEMGELVVKCIERNPPLSTWPEWKYRKVISTLKSREFVSVEKDDDKKKIVTPLVEIE